MAWLCRAMEAGESHEVGGCEFGAWWGSEAEEPRRAGDVSVELPGAAEVEEHRRVWAAEAEEPCGVGAVSMEFHGAGAIDVEEQCWMADTALIAAEPIDLNCT